jgi:hypothetical protein
LTENKAPQVAWDAKTVDYFVKEQQFNVQVTGVTRRRGFGTTRPLEEIMYQARASVISAIVWFSMVIGWMSENRT